MASWLNYGGKGLKFGSNIKVCIPNVSIPFLIFEFSDSSYVPSSDHPSGYVFSGSDISISGTSYYGEWSRVSTSPNRWKWQGWGLYEATGDIGWPLAFKGSLSSANACKIIDYGGFDNFDHTFNSLDRCFYGCTGLTDIATIGTPITTLNVNQAFSGCINVTSGALDQYNYWKTYNTNINSHSSTFLNCGSDTVTGLAELNQIPVGWGGNLVPVANTWSGTRKGSSTNGYTAWQMSASGSDVAIPFNNLTGDLYLFTTASISAYAGVNMRKTNIRNLRNGLDVSTSATYYYPMFWQTSGTPYYPTNTTSNIPLTWIRTTSMYNGMLDASTAAGDMPGTLDYETYGAMDKEFGTYDTTRGVYFGFLVLNSPITSSFNWSTTPYGIHSNTNFKNTVFRWFEE